MGLIPAGGMLDAIRAANIPAEALPVIQVPDSDSTTLRALQFLQTSLTLRRLTSLATSLGCKVSVSRKNTRPWVHCAATFASGIGATTLVRFVVLPNA